MHLSITALRSIGSGIALGVLVGGGLLPSRVAAQASKATTGNRPAAAPAAVRPVAPKTTLPAGALPRPAAGAVSAAAKPQAAAPVVAAPSSPYEVRWSAPIRLEAPRVRGRRMPSFAGAAHDKATGLPTYGFRVEGQRLSALALRAPRVEAVPAAEAALLTAAPLGAEFAIELTVGTETRRPVTLVTVLPLRRNAATGTVERLLGFDIATTAATTPPERPTARAYAATSVLAQGQWVKIGITASGMYRLDRNQLQNLGFGGAALNNIQVWGNGGRMLPQLNRTPRPDDLVQNPVLAEENNGSLSAITFYAEGPHGWNYQPATGRYTRELNLYSDTAFYFLTTGAAPGRRVATVAAPGTPTGAPITSFDEHTLSENQFVSLLKQGRDWFGEAFDSFTPSRDFAFTLDGYIAEVPAYLTVRAVASSTTSTSTYTASVNSQTVGSFTCAQRSTLNYTPVATAGAGTWPLPTGAIGADNRAVVRLQFASSGGGASGNLDYIDINYRRVLRRTGGYTTFRVGSAVAPGAVRQYDVANCDGTTQVWDVTNPRNPRRQILAVNGSTGSFVAAADSLREFIVFNPAEARTDVRSFGAVPNQNLHALNTGGEQLDLLIVTHPQFKGQAERLAAHRRAHDSLQVAVVTTPQVWNEFGSGRQDITAIRDLMRLVYDRTPDPAARPLSLLLFGDASYDYKSNRWYGGRAGSPTTPTPNNTNFVPVYQARESLDPIDAFSSEDYYGLMDDSEGFWDESNASELMDVGIGRLPAYDDASAATLVDKLIRYDSPDGFGNWRNRLAYVTDDSDFGYYQDEADTYITTKVEAVVPTFNSKKIYLDLYPQVGVPSGQRAPACVAAIEQALDQGSLIVNYIGHGGETGWAAEQILGVGDINNWRNANRLTFMITATCEFGRYDDPARPSGGEYSFYNAQGGTIGLFTTTRPVFASQNTVLNTELHRQVFRRSASGINARPRIGEILRRTKTGGSTSAVGSRNFALLGDPSMRLASPRLAAVVTHVNGRPADVVDTLRALTTVNLRGEVHLPGGAVATNFTGRIQVTVFDKAAVVQNLGDENTPVRSFNVRESVIYDGLASVTNGQWTATFVVPRDISYSFGQGKISLYAWMTASDATGNRHDAAGANTTTVIGGSSAGAAQDRTPPEIKLFMDALSFQNGGTTGTDATLIAPLYDASGINTAGTGIGHEITVILDGNRQNVLVMNPYYTAAVDSFQRGTVRYLFKGLTPGPHSLTLKAWDTFNNSAERTLEFVVTNTSGLTINNVLNYPNPFANATTFHFDHNRQGDDLDVQVQLFTVSGRLVRTLQTRLPAAKPHVGDVAWDGRDEYGDVLGRGVYVYKVNVRSSRDGSHTSKYEKLVILN